MSGRLPDKEPPLQPSGRQGDRRLDYEIDFRPRSVLLPITRSDAEQRLASGRYRDGGAGEAIRVLLVDLEAAGCPIEFAPEPEPATREQEDEEPRDPWEHWNDHLTLKTSGGSAHPEATETQDVVLGRIPDHLPQGMRIEVWRNRSGLIRSHNARLDAEKKLAEAEKEVLHLRGAIRRLHDLARMAAPTAERAFRAGKRVQEAAAAEVERW